MAGTGVGATAATGTTRIVDAARMAAKDRGESPAATANADDDSLAD